MSQAFEKYWMEKLSAVQARFLSRDIVTVKHIAQRAYEAGRRHEINKQRHIAAIHKIIDQE